MPKAQVQTESTNRFNPYVSRGISKSLLTPCRQVGLSRNRKTPNSAKNSSFSSPTSSNLDTTPVSSKTTSNESICEAVESKVLESVTDKKKTKVPKCLITDSDEDKIEPSKPTKNTKVSKRLIIDSDEEESVPLVCLKAAKSDELDSIASANSESPNKTKIKPKSRVNTKASKKTKQETKNIEIDNITCTNSNEAFKKTGATANLDKEATSPQNVAEVVIKLDTSVIKSNKSPLKNKKCEAKTKIIVESQHQDIVSISEQVVPLKNVTNCEVAKNDSKNSDIEGPPLPEKKTKKIKRSLSMKKSSSFEYDDIILKECSVDLTQIDRFATVGPKISSEIKNLEKMIKEKQKLVDELKQAEIYQKKHNVEELQHLTALWKTGCVSALIDLLPQLQAHASMDMATLLKNLKVPKELICLAANGDLV